MKALFESSYDPVFDTQRVFRSVMDAMARPGKIKQLPFLPVNPPPGLNPYSARIALTLMDNETTFNVLPDCASWRDYLRLNTGARPVGLGQAEFVVAAGDKDLEEMLFLNRGELQFPERSANLILSAERIAAGRDGDIRMLIQGPGVKGIREIAFTGIKAANLDRLVVLNREFPLGVEAIIVDKAGCAACLPRSAQIRWEVAD